MTKYTKSSPWRLDWQLVCHETETPFVIDYFETEYSDSSDLWHQHRNFGELVVVLGGSACNASSERYERLAPGDVQFLPPGSTHHYSRIHQFRHYLILVQAGILHQLPESFRTLSNYSALFDTNGKPSPILHIEPGKLPEIMEALEAMRREYLSRRSGWQAAVYTHFCHALLNILRSAGSSASDSGSAFFQIGRTIRHMEENPFRAFSIGDLSTFAQMSATSFRRNFRKLTGFSPIDYLIRLRLKRAVLAVVYTDEPISEIAIQSGFADGSYFARQFRSLFGMSARDFRKAFHNGAIDLTQALKKLQLSAE